MSSCSSDNTLGEVTKSSPSSAAASKSPNLDPGFEAGFASSAAADTKGDFDAGDATGGDEATGTPDSTIGMLGIGGATGTIGADPFNLLTSLFMCNLKAPTYKDV